MVTPTAVRSIQPTVARMMKPTQSMSRGMMYRENRVPYYQRLYQQHDGKRQWWKTHRSPYLLYPYYTLLWGTFAASQYMMVRMVLGHRTWFAKE